MKKTKKPYTFDCGILEFLSSLKNSKILNTHIEIREKMDVFKREVGGFDFELTRRNDVALGKMKLQLPKYRKTGTTLAGRYVDVFYFF